MEENPLCGKGTPAHQRFAGGGHSRCHPSPTRTHAGLLQRKERKNHRTVDLQGPGFPCQERHHGGGDCSFYRKHLSTRVQLAWTREVPPMEMQVEGWSTPHFRLFPRGWAPCWFSHTHLCGGQVAVGTDSPWMEPRLPTLPSAATGTSLKGHPLRAHYPNPISQMTPPSWPRAPQGGSRASHLQTPLGPAPASHKLALPSGEHPPPCNSS